MFHYKKEFGSYYFYGDTDRFSFMSDSVSVLFDEEHGVMHRHGRPGTVSAYLKNLNQAGLGENMIIITSDKWKCEELNKILSTTGYVKRLGDPKTRDSFFEA
jgi:hypothetical protein